MTSNITETPIPPDGIFFPDMRTYVTGVGQILAAVHHKEDCAGRVCVIHNQTKHSMRKFPTNWRYDRYLMERICPHGVGHPDPDDLEWRKDLDEGDPLKDSGVHGCDGCCGVPE